MEVATTTQQNTLNPASAFVFNESRIIEKQKEVFSVGSYDQDFEPGIKNPDISKISWFVDLGEEQNDQEDEFPEIKFSNLISEYKKEFERLLQSRLNYLTSLKNLKNNWISGPNQIPSTVALDSSKSILSSLFSIYFDYFANSFFIPKIIMGPIPSGGVSIECQINEQITLFFSVFNNGGIDEYIDLDGFYHELLEEGGIDQIYFPVIPV